MSWWSTTTWSRGYAVCREERRPPVGAALAFNGARLVGYALLGALLATVYGTLGALLPLQGIAWAGRIVAVIVMAALALRLLTGRDWLGVERFGGWAWQGLRMQRLPCRSRCCGSCRRWSRVG